MPIANRFLRLGLIQWWCKRLLTCLNIKVEVTGLPPNNLKTHGVMLVANHISWIDIHAINSLLPVRFIAKMEIKSWPLFGYLVAKSGTIFINRTQRKDTLRVVDIATEALKSEDNLCFFPEGTTTEGDTVLPFKSSILACAINAKATVIPMAIRYPLPNNELNRKAAYADETTLIESIGAYLCMQEPRVQITFLDPIENTDTLTRQELGKLTESRIKEAVLKQAN